MAERVRITDVSPRDGLQNEPGFVPTLDKATLVEKLCTCGVDEVEVTSFVSAKWVPQLGDASEVLAEAAKSKHDGVRFSALVPNAKGMESALNAMRAAQPAIRVGPQVRPLDKVAVFTAASETFSRRNTNAGIRETIERFVPVIAMAKAERILVRGYISCAIACPFEGAIAPENVAAVAGLLVDAGVDELDLGDTIGAGTPESVANMLRSVLDRVGEQWLGRAAPGERAITLHLHDTFGRAAECVKVALDMGIRSFDGSVAGLGGCPYASTPGKRAPGNISTELLVRTVHESGYETGVDLDRLATTAEYARSLVSKARARAAGGGA
jgi:hydroxymethylglutaryl-CoA lyase